MRTDYRDVPASEVPVSRRTDARVHQSVFGGGRVWLERRPDLVILPHPWEGAGAPNGRLLYVPDDLAPVCGSTTTAAILEAQLLPCYSRRDWELVADHLRTRWQAEYPGLRWHFWDRGPAGWLVEITRHGESEVNASAETLSLATARCALLWAEGQPDA